MRVLGLQQIADVFKLDIAGRGTTNHGVFSFTFELLPLTNRQLIYKQLSFDATVNIYTEKLMQTNSKKTDT